MTQQVTRRPDQGAAEASVRFYADHMVTVEVDGESVEFVSPPIDLGLATNEETAEQAWDRVTHKAVQQLLLDQATDRGRTLQVTSEEADGAVWEMTVAPGATVVTDVRQRTAERRSTRAGRAPRLGAVPDETQPPQPTSRVPDVLRLPDVPDLRAKAAAPPVAPPSAPRRFDADPRPELPGRRDLVKSRPQARGGPAVMGWQGTVESLLGFTGWHPAPGRAEKAHRREVRIIERPLPTTKLIAVINPTGGVGKSTLTLAVAAAIGRHQSRGVLAWDLNPNKGTLGMRTSASEEQAALTAEDLLAALPDFEAGRPLSDLDTFVRPQGEQRFEVLAAPRAAAGGLGAAGDETAWMRTEGGWVIGWDEFHRIYPWLASYYRAIVVDTGNKQDPVWWAIMSRAHQLVIPLSLSEHAIDVTLDTCNDLERLGFAHLVRDAVTVINSPSRISGPQAQRQRQRVHQFFGPQPNGQPGRTRMVLDMPFDPALALGEQVDFARMPERRRRPGQRVAAAAMEHL